VEFDGVMADFGGSLPKFGLEVTPSQVMILLTWFVAYISFAAGISFVVRSALWFMLVLCLVFAIFPRLPVTS